ncbi:MAG: hypothetical protein GY899_01170 [Verrucomicrobiaceae bacterium]|nr:hypothetical protein [Verrucomicrobiaceae bacterium]
MGASGSEPSRAQSGRHYELSVRASRINPEAGEHPKINYTFTDKNGKITDLQHAAVDTRVVSRGQLVIWLMSHNQRLFESITGYGLHAIQPHYANRWFSTVPRELHDAGNCLGDIRLEAATGDDHSKLVDIPKPDGLAARSLELVKWLVENNPEGKWEQFLTGDGDDLLWEKVILSGSSHGSTTSARLAKQRKVARVVMFCGPRDQLESWQGLPSATPANRYFGFTHVLDTGWTGDHYCRSWQMLGLSRFGSLVNVDMAKPPFGNSRRLVTNCDVKNDPRRAHGIVVRGDAWDEVWRYLYTHPVEQTGKPGAPDPDCRMDLRRQ